MPPFQFRLSSTFRRARRLSHAAGVPLSLPGVDFAGHASTVESAVWRLLLEALDDDQISTYWERRECCEGCVEDSREPIRRIESLVRLTRSTLGREAPPASLALLTALDEAIREHRDYLRLFTPDLERHTPWGAGSRDDYLQAMHSLRAHLAEVLRQVRFYVGLPAANGVEPGTRDQWARHAYTVFGQPPV